MVLATEKFKSVEELINSKIYTAGYLAKEQPESEDERRIRFVISSEKVDRHGEIVKQDAVEKSIKDFSANPVSLAVHLHSSSTGRSTVVGSWDTDSYKRYKTYSEMDLIFAKDVELAEEYFKLYSQKHMRAVSIGFYVRDAVVETVRGVKVYVITEIELVEISCVAVPANRQALQKALDAQENEGSISQLIDERVSKLEQRFEEKFEELKMLICDPDSLVEGDDDTDDEFEADDSDGTNGKGGVNDYISAIDSIIAKQRAAD